jgi:hypothetical protein
MPRFGEEVDYDKEDQLFKMMDYGNGAVFYDYRYLPKDAAEFVVSQFRRFNVPLPPQISPLTLLGPALAASVVDYYDPYILFWEFSDVMYTDEWCNFTYDIYDVRGNCTEADPSQLETYRFMPGNAERVFEQWMQKPGLKELPNYLTPYMRDATTDYFDGNHYPYPLYNVADYPSPEQLSFLVERACTNKETGEVNDKWIDAYYDLVQWAGMLWMFGPPSREFRRENSEIFEVCLGYGECILYDGVVINPKFYKRTERVPLSCYRCGVDAWCVDATLDVNGVARNICEGCLTKGMPRIEGCTCGTKFCKYFECPHNQWHGKDAAGLRDVMRTHGQLAKKAETARMLLDGGEPKRLLING